MKKLILILVPGLFLFSQGIALADSVNETIEFEGSVDSDCSLSAPNNGTFTASGGALTVATKGSVEVTSNGGALISVSNPTYSESPAGFDSSGSATPWATIDDGDDNNSVSSSNGSSEGSLTAGVGTNTYFVSVSDLIDEIYIAGDYKMEVVVTCEFNTGSTGGFVPGPDG